LKSIDSGNTRSDDSYDVANELTSETQTLSGQAAKIVSYTYDADGNRATTTYPSGKLVELAWTPRNQLASVTYDGPPPIANYAYDLGGRLSSISHENGIVENKTYDNANRLLSNIHSHAGSATGGDTYTLDTTGRRTAEAFADGTTPARSYGYDPTDQVTAADYGAGKTDAYAYDPMGNRSTATLAKDSGATTSYTTNTANQYTGISAQAAPTFDANGNLLSGNGVNYTWDSENRLLSYADATNRIDATYDALHRRLAKKVTNLATHTVTSNTQYVYDGWNVIEEINLTSNTLAKTLIWGSDISGSLQGAGGVGGLLQVSNLTAGVSSHFHYDGNGNVTQLTDDSGAATATYRYDAFGNTLVATGPAAALNNYRFSTKPIDGEVANAPLYYYGYRFYDPLTGRWPSRDPIAEMGGLNLYGFVRNDGINYIDALGLEFWETHMQKMMNDLNALKADLAKWEQVLADTKSTLQRVCLSPTFKSGLEKLVITAESRIQDLEEAIAPLMEELEELPPP
jgi:RHS repeat-associated protein